MTGASVVVPPDVLGIADYDLKYLVILRKQADGSWKIARAASSSSIAPPSPAPQK